MSHAAAFIQRVYADANLRNQVIALGQDSNALLRLASDNGFHFTSEEFQAAVREAGYGGGEELSEAELANVAGGANTDSNGWTGCGSGQSGCLVTGIYGGCSDTSQCPSTPGGAP